LPSNASRDTSRANGVEVDFDTRVAYAALYVLFTAH
jgi:hypothetical protein